MDRPWPARVLTLLACFAALSLGSSPIDPTRVDILTLEGMLASALMAIVGVISWKRTMGESKTKTSWAFQLAALPLLAYSAARFLYVPKSMPGLHPEAWVHEARVRGLQASVAGLLLLLIGMHLAGQLRRRRRL